MEMLSFDPLLKLFEHTAIQQDRVDDGIEISINTVSIRILKMKHYYIFYTP